MNLLFKNRVLAFLVSVFFATHPINTLFVNYITASVFAIQLIVMSWSVITFVLAQKGKKSLHLYLASLILFLLAGLCHETALALPFYLMATTYLLNDRTSRTNWAIYLPYFLITIILLSLKLQITIVASNFFQKAGHLPIHLFSYLATISQLIIWYLSKLVSLQGIVLIFKTPLIKENVAAWVTVLFILLGLFFSSFRWKKNAPEIPFAISWLMIGFMTVAVGSVYELKHGFLIEPHWLFFPSLGFFILLAYCLLYLNRFLPQRYIYALIVVIILIFVTTTRNLNQIWAEEKRYCQYWAKQAPNFAAPLSYLASAYMGEGNFLLARKCLNEIINMGFSDGMVYYKIGSVDLAEGKIEEAQQNFKKALEFSPESSVIHYSLALVNLKKMNGIPLESIY